MLSTMKWVFLMNFTGLPVLKMGVAKTFGMQQIHTVCDAMTIQQKDLTTRLNAQLLSFYLFKGKLILH